MTDKHDMIERIGTALWGDTWQSQMARALEIDSSTVRRWVARKTDPRPGVFVDLIRIMQERAAALDDLAEETKRYGGGL
ncbi:hypothetical protein GCM10011452_09070 [Gemmobacter lanyuensis]|uniref:Uncharacterized protein n=1 Tax=Gemmobacter lanyuensis TaxID=1054497 RepID=A0A918IP08_9RHOB|nr:hypothetical protein [Gemmobacter lanyuensis]GGW23910.1 hypothetical protein GCM10011452_09070 [Gemmobacter lanyuensis]